MSSNAKRCVISGLASTFPIRTVCSSGVVAVSTSLVVIEILRSHRVSRCRSTFVPCTPTLAIMPPGAMMFAKSKVAESHRFDRGIDSAPARHLLDGFDGLAVRLLTRGRPEALGGSRRLSSRSIMMTPPASRIERSAARRVRSARADNRNGASRLNFAVEHAALEARRQDVSRACNSRMFHKKKCRK